MAAGAISVGSLGLGFQALRMPSSSMYPTLDIGDHIYIEKVSKLWRAPRRGDVVVFEKPCEPERDYVKRIVALANDTVEIRCDVVYINGEPLAQTLVDGNCTYLDLREEESEWISQTCSRYRETIDGVDYELFFDRGRPVRDAMLHANGALTREDVAPIARTEFPQLEGRGSEPPVCGFNPELVDEQKPGTIVTTKQNAGPCDLQMHYVVPED
jgi:signal peptidase I